MTEDAGTVCDEVEVQVSVLFNRHTDEVIEYGVLAIHEHYCTKQQQPSPDSTGVTPVPMCQEMLMSKNAC